MQDWICVKYMYVDAGECSDLCIKITWLWIVSEAHETEAQTLKMIIIFIVFDV